MAAEVLIMPRQGNTVESCIIVRWKEAEGRQDERADRPSARSRPTRRASRLPATAGRFLKILYQEGDDVPVLTVIAVVGDPGEEVGAMLAGATVAGKGGSAATAASSADAAAPALGAASGPASAAQGGGAGNVAAPLTGGVAAPTGGAARAISPRARNLAQGRGLDYSAVVGSGPGGRIIERDVEAALERRSPLTPAARAAMKAGVLPAPAEGSGIGGRVRAADLTPKAPGASVGPSLNPSDNDVELPVRGVRKLIGERMRASLRSTAQLTIDMSADATTLLAFRKRLKASPPERGLSEINLNDMVMFAAAKTVAGFKELNAHFLGDKIVQFARVHLGFAVDTPRGLMVPVIRDADLLSLRELAVEARRLASACLGGAISPDELAGGTFTVTNLGGIGVERFTPVLNAPQVAILGVNAIQLKPVQSGEQVTFVPHIGLSLTIDHQAVDGAPAARFLKALCENIAQLDMTLAG